MLLQLPITHGYHELLHGAIYQISLGFWQENTPTFFPCLVDVDIN